MKKIKSMEIESCPGWKKPLVFVACGFGLGLSPVASGTAGTLPGLALVLGLRAAGFDAPPFDILAALLLAAAAVPLCDIAEKHFKRKDDGRIVADEFMTFPICMLGLPSEAWVFAAAFLTNRFFDILKPPPARRLQDCEGGLGIVADDAVSCLYSLAANHAIVFLARTCFF